MTWNEFYNKLTVCSMISNNWKHLLELIETEIKALADADNCLKLFTLYFSLIEDGNAYMPLSEEKLKDKLDKKTECVRTRLQEKDENVGTVLQEIKDESDLAFSSLKSLDALPVIGNGGLFIVDDHGGEKRLFSRKHYSAKNKILVSAGRLFKENTPELIAFDYKSAFATGFSLSDGQKEVLEKGIYNNILVTGGPGTGKTTSILFLLIALLEKHPDYDIYMTAPSGKAAARMKQSVLQSLDCVSEAYKYDHEDIIEKIKGLDHYTIHRLLKFDRDKRGFAHNSQNMFSEKSIFVIDEASMIDIVIFSALLEAISDGARVFILGDKNQLPSVECGAVFGEWLEHISSENKVELTESKRFERGSDIYNLAEAVNNDDVLPVGESDWKPLDSFDIKAPLCKADNKRENKLYYYNGVTDCTMENLNLAVLKWYNHFFAKLPSECIDIAVPLCKEYYDELDNIKQKEKIEDVSTKLDGIYAISESSRILCADNESVRGVNHINQLILKKKFKSSNKVSGYYPGELLMITKNNSSLELYNGDSGVAVMFEGDDTIYGMFKKTPENLKLDEGLVQNRISKIGDYLFYPLRLISSDEITPAFAITIHKSQGSDYGDILVILPKTSGHPLLNRQIVYTAITRTKGDMYMIANQENLEYAKKTVLTRDTGIFK